MRIIIKLGIPKEMGGGGSNGNGATMAPNPTEKARVSNRINNKKRSYQNKYRRIKLNAGERQELYDKNIENIKAWRRFHPDYQAKWRLRNRARYNDLHRTWRRRNLEKRRIWIREYMRDYRRGIRRRKKQ